VSFIQVVTELKLFPRYDGGVTERDIHVTVLGDNCRVISPLRAARREWRHLYHLMSSDFIPSERPFLLYNILKYTILAFIRNI
jgi:hypothetical protein